MNINTQNIGRAVINNLADTTTGHLGFGMKYIAYCQTPVLAPI